MFYCPQGVPKASVKFCQNGVYMVLTLCKHFANTVTAMVFHDKVIKMVDKNLFPTILEMVTKFLFVLCL